MVVIKCSDAIKGPRVKVDGPQCGGLYKEDHGSIIPWLGTDPDAKMNSSLGPFIASEHFITTMVNISPSGDWLLFFLSLEPNILSV